MYLKFSKILTVVCMGMLLAGNAFGASSDEFQVYDDAINQPGELGVDLHMNYVPSGIQLPAYPGEIPAEHNFRLTPEFAYGLDKHWEAGLYLPVIRDESGNLYAEGAKVRMKYIADHPETGAYWGINMEFGYSSHRTEIQNWNLELRPILGFQNDNWNLTLNPILDVATSGSNNTPDFAPSLKISHKVNDKTWISIEQYSDFGQVDHLRSHTQETFLTTDTEVFGHEINFGVGHGWTKASNDWTIKMIYNIPIIEANQK
jgi:hypothetical protein